MHAKKTAVDVARCLVDAGHSALFAGGCVRDHRMGRTPSDYDIATSATPQQVLKIFPNSNEVGAHFGVVIVKSGAHALEVATFRTDGCYGDGRRPDHVVFSTPEEDAKRRDFTINGLFEDPFSGEIIDYVGGCADLAAGVLRAIGDPHLRFSEDALRLMRVVRFATTLDFEIEQNTWQAVRTHAALLAKISPERIRDELVKMLVSPRRARALQLLVDSGLIEQFWPEVLALIGCEQPPEWHPEGDVFTHTKIMLDMLGPEVSPELALAVLLHDIAKPPSRTIDAEAGNRIRFNGHDALGAEMAGDMLRRLRFSNEVIDAVIPMVARHMQFMSVQNMRVAKLKRFMASPTFTQELELHRVDCGSSNGFTDNYEFLLEKREEFSLEPLIPPPLVTGRDLIAAGLAPGPKFSEILRDIETEQLEGKLKTREDALEYFRSRWLQCDA